MNHAGEQWDGEIICSGDSENCECREDNKWGECAYEGGGICYCLAVEKAIENREGSAK